MTNGISSTAVPATDRIAMAVGLRLLLRAHDRAARRPARELERQRQAREDAAVRQRDLLLPLR